MKTKGTGRVVVLGLGSIRESGVMPDRPVIVDNGRLVAWESALSYELTINTSLFARIVQSRITDEGVMLKFKGTGKVLVSLRNKCGFFDQILNSITEKAVKNG